MGITGSSHIKVLGDCYDLKEDRTYSGFETFGASICGCIFFIITVVLIVANFSTSFKNKFLIGSLIFSVLLCLYLSFLQPVITKWMYAKNNGTKVECPKPKPECDAAYKQFLIDSKSNKSYDPYSCDERLKYF